MRCIRVLALVAAVTGLSFGVVGTASAAPKGGKILFFATSPPSGNTGTIVVTGAIGDYGTVQSIDKNGKPDANGGYVKVTLKNGTFEVNSVANNKYTNNAPPTLQNKTTCSFAFEAAGPPVTFFDGTGAYAGISGSAHIQQFFGGIGPRLESGACNNSQNAQPVAASGLIVGNGTVAFS